MSAHEPEGDVAWRWWWLMDPDGTVFMRSQCANPLETDAKISRTSSKVLFQVHHSIHPWLGEYIAPKPFTPLARPYTINTYIHPRTHARNGMHGDDPTTHGLRGG